MPMPRPVTSLLLGAALAMAACAPAAAGKRGESPAPDAPPALVVAISVDQFSADLFAQYRQGFSGGMRRLLDGAVFASGFQSHAATETCPGHSTILTGVRPARSGIIANNWFDLSLPRADKQVYCAEDERDPASTSSEPVVSARHLKALTLGERLKAANPASLNVAVAGKDRAAMMMGGNRVDHALWWKGSGFVTFPGAALPSGGEAINRRIAARIGKGEPAYAAPRSCAARDRPVKVGDGTIGTWKFPMTPRLPQTFQSSPRLDAAVVDMAVAALDAYGLGRDASPDVLAVGLSATDYVGHAFGSEGVEMCIQMAELDRTVGRLLAELDKRHLDYVVVLTADHGAIDAPERLVEQGYPSATRAAPDLAPKALSAEISALTGIAPTSGQLLYGGGGSGDIYVTPQIDAARKTKVLKALVDRLKAHPQVAAVYTAKQLAETPLPSGSPQDWTLLDRARASFDPRRSGDVVVLLDRAVVPVAPRAGYTTTHGSVWDYDRRVPIVFWRRGMAGLEQPQPVETVDIAPTLAALLRLPVGEGEFDGRCLDIDGGAGNICAR